MITILKSKLRFITSIFLILHILPILPAISQSRSATFEAQITNLDNAASTIRIAAIRTLAKLDEEETIAAVPLIAARLRDEDPKVRIVAARTLGRLGDMAREAVVDIGQILTDNQFIVTPFDSNARFQSVAMSAAAALADLGPTAFAALENLLHALKSNDSRLRAASAKAIGYMGRKASQAGPALVSALKDPSAETRFEAAFALGHIGPLPDAAVTALKNSLTDTEIFVETLPSGAQIIGSVRIAAAEALLNLDRKHLTHIKRHGGALRQTTSRETDLPWSSGRRLHFAADETDIRDLIAIVLMANQMTVSFRRDIEGFLTFEFVGMPAQGAFNMLLHDYNLSYEWDNRLRHVSIFPYKSLQFREPLLQSAEVIKLPKRENLTKLRKSQDSRRLTNHATATTLDDRSAEKATKSLKNSLVITEKPIKTDENEDQTNTKEPSRDGAKSKATYGDSAQKKIKRFTGKQPAVSGNSIQLGASTDISEEHKLSFIIKFDGLYRAMIDGQEYTTGMSISTLRGDMVIVDVRKRTVHLIQKAGKGFKKFVLRHRRRR